jgi:hypothetical protein
MATLECKLAMCIIRRLVEFELLLELKIEQNHGTSLVKLVLSRRKSASRQSVCPSQWSISISVHSTSGNCPFICLQCPKDFHFLNIFLSQNTACFLLVQNTYKYPYYSLKAVGGSWIPELELNPIQSTPCISLIDGAGRHSSDQITPFYCIGAWWFD